MCALWKRLGQHSSSCLASRLLIVFLACNASVSAHLSSFGLSCLLSGCSIWSPSMVVLPDMPLLFLLKLLFSTQRIKNSLFCNNVWFLQLYKLSLLFMNRELVCVHEIWFSPTTGVDKSYEPTQTSDVVGHQSGISIFVSRFPCSQMSVRWFCYFDFHKKASDGVQAVNCVLGIQKIVSHWLLQRKSTILIHSVQVSNQWAPHSVRLDAIQNTM